MNRIESEKKIKNLVHSLRYEKGHVCAIDVLLGMDYLSKKEVELWRFGKVNYLEQVCNGSLGKLSFVNKCIRKHASELKLEASWTSYNQYGKGAKRRLRFSKSGEKNIEDAYATHYIDKKRILEIKQAKAENNHKNEQVGSINDINNNTLLQ